MKKYFQLIRAYQYIKNLFILIPIFFSGQITNWHLLKYALFSFVSFSLIASVIYIINDYIDIEKDRLHPIKRERPLASGTLTLKKAFAVAFIFACIGFTSAFFINLTFVAILFTYFIINLIYCLYLKNVSLIDICIIAFGFELRIFAGSAATGLIISKWLVIMTFLLALFLALAKRRDDLLLLQTRNLQVRPSLKGYTIDFISFSMIMMASVLIVAYLMYCISPEIVQNLHHDFSYISVIWVVLGILRYFQITFVEEKSADPTKIMLKDKFILTVVSLWFLTNLILIYY